MKIDVTTGILIFTDGACSGNPGPGGWGSVVALPDGKIFELGGRADATTNNQMELNATIEALASVKARNEKIYLYTDSTYVIRGITQWIWGWRSRGWKTSEGADVLNRDLWEKLWRLVSAREKGSKIDWRYSRGHIGTPGNERCDQIAVGFSQRKYVDLFDGTLLKYPVAIYDIPENHELLEMKPVKEKKAAYSYLSLLDGQVYRHRSWTECERRVKGKSGAKFKKAMSAEDEPQILQEWGLTNKNEIKE